MVSLGKPPPVLLSTEVFSALAVEIASSLLRNLRINCTASMLNFFSVFLAPPLSPVAHVLSGFCLRQLIFWAFQVSNDNNFNFSLHKKG